MDAAGAEEVRRRIEGHEHWRQAEAVRDGRQPPSDPDAHELEEIRDGVRYYRAADNHRMIKKLVAGAWDTSFIAPETTQSSTFG
jgi:hypothetical protein